jgi:small-conductance mechanosensitive channel
LIRLIVYTLRRGSTPNAALRAWEGIISTSIWILVAFHLLGWLPGLLEALDGLAITVGEAHISILSVIKTILAISAFIVMANWLSTLIDRKVRRSNYLSSSMRVGISKISRLFLFSLAILTGLHTVGIDLTALTVFGGALGVGLGFGLQRIASNFISGFILLFDRSIKPGDVISIGERFGWVQALHARYIVVRDRDGVETLIPNENLITSEVTNWSYTDRHVRVKIPVQISYIDNPEIAMDLLVKASECSDRILQDPPAQARLTGFGDSGINLELRIWLSDPEAGVGSVKSEINLMIWKLFNEHGITIPFPQREVRML